MALRALAEATLSQGREAPPDYRLPPNQGGCRRIWREELLRRNASIEGK